ncbi:urease accessory protein UreH [Ectobacillus ponti]|uniref:Urease accessory protein UreH n=1 Tax=Ectobacillus ponti TaxID=2961894 RepID=A0AA41X861_9BACI|nr:urease accessory protein UreH [Ectobacillus ponti]MCP8970522.1 urease accessory protein UreH [Ectobacillus ponti]
MITGYISILALGFLLGMKHSIEPDHVVAVATAVSGSRKLSRSTLTGVFWGIGHTATLLLVGMLLVLTKGQLSEKWAMSLEFLVGIMLVCLGARGLLSLQKDYSHQAASDAAKRSFLKVTMIGFVHGLAGSAAMTVLTMSMVNTVWEGAVYILVFGIGTILGMLGFTTVIGIPFVYSGKKNMLANRFLLRCTGAVSLVFGMYYMYNLGVSEHLFRMWLQ